MIELVEVVCGCEIVHVHVQTYHQSVESVSRISQSNQSNQPIDQSIDQSGPWKWNWIEIMNKWKMNEYG